MLIILFVELTATLMFPPVPSPTPAPSVPAAPPSPAVAKSQKRTLTAFVYSEVRVTQTTQPLL